MQRKDRALTETSDRIDQLSFELVKAKKQTLLSDLRSKVPAMNGWDFEAFCGRAHIKFQEGEASCETHISSVFAIKNKAQSKQLIDSVRKVVIDGKGFQAKSFETAMHPNYDTALSTKELDDNSKVRYVVQVFKETVTGMRCLLQHELRRKEYAASGQPELQTYFTCSQQARNTWFPRNDL